MHPHRIRTGQQTFDDITIMKQLFRFDRCYANGV